MHEEIAEIHPEKLKGRPQVNIPARAQNFYYLLQIIGESLMYDSLICRILILRCIQLQSGNRMKRHKGWRQTLSPQQPHKSVEISRIKEVTSDMRTPVSLE
ncbi:MAG: hypothetical protein AAB951_01220 [Patescibacteria group bacterium]